MGNEFQIIRECKVLYVNDDDGGLRIKVHIGREDGDYTSIDKLPWCFPLLPKHLHINPKIGETVLVLLSKTDSPKKRRWFIGPLISQQYFLDYDGHDGWQSRSILDRGEYVSPLPNPDRDPGNVGTCPDREDIAIQGRKNSDIIFKPNELRLRCGFLKYPFTKSKNSLKYNDEDMAYVQMKYKTNEKFNSCINIVADRINLLTHQKHTKTPFTLIDKAKNELITDEEQTRIEDGAHPIIFGDELVDFLNSFLDIFERHSHPWAQDAPALSKADKETLHKTPLKEMLSKAIKIN